MKRRSKTFQVSVELQQNLKKYASTCMIVYRDMKSIYDIYHGRRARVANFTIIPRGIMNNYCITKDSIVFDFELFAGSTG